MVLTWPERGLAAGSFQNVPNGGTFIIRERGEILIKGIYPGERQHGQERQGEQEQAAGLKGSLTYQNAAILGEGPYAARFAAPQRPQIAGKNGLPEFHPNKKRGQDKGALGEVLGGKSAAAHVRPKIKEAEDEGNRAEIVGG